MTGVSFRALLVASVMRLQGSTAPPVVSSGAHDAACTAQEDGCIASLVPVSRTDELDKLYKDVMGEINRNTTDPDALAWLKYRAKAVLALFLRYWAVPVASHMSAADQEEYGKRFGAAFIMGLHSPWNLEWSTERTVINLIQSFVAGRRSGGLAEQPFHKVLVLGCGLGWGASRLRNLSYQAWGVDSSMPAIAMASGVRGNTCLQDDEPCFLHASMTNLPWATGKFDAAISVDDLQNLLPEDVPKAAAEISRVVQKYLFLMIPAYDDTESVCRNATGSTCTRTMQNKTWWLQQFAPFGWTPLVASNSGKTAQLRADLVLAKNDNPAA